MAACCTPAISPLASRGYLIMPWFRNTCMETFLLLVAAPLAAALCASMYLNAALSSFSLCKYCSACMQPVGTGPTSKVIPDRPTEGNRPTSALFHVTTTTLGSMLMRYAAISWAKVSLGCINKQTPVAAVVLCRSKMKSHFGVGESLGPNNALISFALRCSYSLLCSGLFRSLSRKHLFRSSSVYLRFFLVASTLASVTKSSKPQPCFPPGGPAILPKLLPRNTPFLSLPWVPPTTPTQEISSVAPRCLHQGSMLLTCRRIDENKNKTQKA
mmetsp:Transcript_11250/g.24851  ORF Transcript_11250/g.24851 Transcript_11250/m.24851 type:complete len:271 (+) Transcript_11250:332-1144(+)